MRSEPRARRAQHGAVLVVVLLFAALTGLLAGTALIAGALDTRIAAQRAAAARARAFAETVLELLAARTAARWSAGGESCPVLSYCAADFPRVEALLATSPPAWRCSVGLYPVPVAAPARSRAALASGVRRYETARIELRVAVEGTATVRLALGLALTRPARGAAP